MELKVNSGVWGTMFGVPCIVADNLLKLATGEQLKVLLFMLRNSGRKLSDEEISINTGVPVMQVQDCILFWQNVNVIIPEGAGSSVPFMQMTAPPAPAPTVQSTAHETTPSAAAENKEQIKHTPRKKENLNPSEIAKLIESSQEIREFFKFAEQKLGDINYTMQNTIIWIHNYLGLEMVVIGTLISYCAEINRKEPRYIEKIAYDWAEKEINDLNAANEEIEQLKQYNEFLYIIKRKFEMKHTPTTKQQVFIKKWQSMGLDIEVIHYAYEKCVENTEKLSFEYIDKVVTSWHASGLTTVEEVKKNGGKFKYNGGNKKGSSSSKLDLEKYKIFINNI